MLRLTADKRMVDSIWSLLENCTWLEEGLAFSAASHRSFSEHRLLRGEQKQGDMLAQRSTYHGGLVKAGRVVTEYVARWRTQLQAHSDTKHRWYQPH